MNAHMTQTVNAHRRPVDFSVGQLVLISTLHLRLPGGALRTKKLSNNRLVIFGFSPVSLMFGLIPSTSVPT
jgi:hypothetical protein